MKVLLVTDTWIPVINGVVTSVSTLRDGLLECGHEVRTLTVNNKIRTVAPKPDPAPVYQVRSLSVEWIYKDARVTPWVPALVRKSIKTWKPEIIHTHGEFSTYIYAKYLAKQLNIPHIHTYHTLYEDYTQYFCPSKTLGKKLVRWITRGLINSRQAAVAPTEKVARLLREYGVKTKIAVIPTGIDLPSLDLDRANLKSKTRAKYGIPTTGLLGVAVGRLGYEKNTRELIEFIRDCPQLSILIVGDGPARKELEKFVDALDLRDRIVFAGAVAHEEVTNLYIAGDIFLSASRSETQGLTTIEAMSCSLPLLCRADDAITGVLYEGENGFSYNNQTEFCAAVNKFSENPELLEKLGGRSRTIAVEKFSKAAFSQAMEELYAECLRESAERQRSL